MIKKILSIWSGFPFEVKTLLAAIIAGAIVLLMILGKFNSYCDSRGQKKINKVNANINEGLRNAAASEGAANVREEIVKEKEVNANEKANISANANANLANVSKRDSNTFSNDYFDAKREFCRDNPTDSLCSNNR
jgi:hypothetical protein